MRKAGGEKGGRRAARVALPLPSALMSDPAQIQAQDAFSLATPYRDATCGEMRSHDVGRDVRLAGWVDRRRDLGHLIFLELRDRFGITQVVVDAKEAPAAHEVATR